MDNLGASLPDHGFESRTDASKSLQTLIGYQSEQDRTKAVFYEIRALIEAWYQEKYEPLFNERFNIVNGVSEVDEKVGVPDFWLNAMKGNEVLAKEITTLDEGPLNYLKDIKWCRIYTHTGFKLDFYFHDTNPYFNNPVLTKTYQMANDDETIVEKLIGTEIDWKHGKDVTKKMQNGELKKRKRGLNKQCCKSFFNFFSSPRVPEDDLDEEAAKELQNILYQDYGVGSTIRDKIIPHAVSWYTGEASQVIYYEGSDMDSAMLRSNVAYSPDRFPQEKVEENLDELPELDVDDSCSPEYMNRCQAWRRELLALEALERLTPIVRKRVSDLRKIQSIYDEFKGEFLMKRAHLEATLQKFNELCYQERFAIVNGGEFPKFWLTVMKAVLKEEITKDDEVPLEYLTDIKWSRIDKFKGFKLDFCFRHNPYFNNAILTKTYRMVQTYDDEPILVEVEWTEIEWKQEKNVVIELTKVWDSSKWRFITRCSKSFFSFFEFPLVFEDDVVIDENKKTVEELQEEVEELEKETNRDYVIGCTIRDKIIPHAVSWFIEEAAC